MHTSQHSESNACLRALLVGMLGTQVYRRETPAEAIEIDRKLQAAWAEHPSHVVVANAAPASSSADGGGGGAGGFETKLETATEAVLRIARATHPSMWEAAQEIKSGAADEALASGGAVDRTSSADAVRGAASAPSSATAKRGGGGGGGTGGGAARSAAAPPPGDGKGGEEGCRVA